MRKQRRKILVHWFIGSLLLCWGCCYRVVVLYCYIAGAEQSIRCDNKPFSKYPNKTSHPTHRNRDRHLFHRVEPGSRLLSIKNAEGYQHAAQITLLIQRCLEEAGVGIEELDAFRRAVGALYFIEGGS